MTQTPPGPAAQDLSPTYSRQPPANTLDLAGTEWLLADGQGGFAMGTAAGIPTRRYHGYLVASTSPPVGRVMCLSSCVETVVENPGTPGQTRRDLCSFHFPGIIHPAGHAALTRFDAGATVRWDYTLGKDDSSIHLTRELCLLRPEQRGDAASSGGGGGGGGGGGAAIIRYTIRTHARDAALEIRPLIALRSLHGLLDGRSCPDRFIVNTLPGVVGIELSRGHPPLPRLNLACDGTRFVSGTEWWHDFDYPLDAQRGLDHREDLFTPGPFVLTVGGRTPTATAELLVWTGDVEHRPTIRFDEAAAQQRRRIHTLITRTLTRAAPQPAPPSPRSPGRGGRVPEAGEGSSSSADAPSDALARLVAASDRFVVRRARTGGCFSSSVIAGYPWFGDWGRDTMLCLPGLMLATGRFEEALSTLETFAGLCKDGLIPNCFDDATGRAAYNTADASLWFIHAACRYAAVTGDTAVLRGAVGRACREIVDSYRRGTLNKIHMDDDGLIAAGDPTMQLTWMDARRDGVVFTPRHGKAVEINALWFNALSSLAAALETDQPNTAREYRSLSERVGVSFREKFWNHRARSCYDVLTPDNAPGTQAPPSPLQPEGPACGSPRPLQPEGLACSSRGLSESASDTPGNRAPPSPLQPEGLVCSSRGLSESASDTPGTQSPSSPHPEGVRPPSPYWRPALETRPNQIYAASLPYSPLDPDQRAAVIDHVRSRLLTPMGLRTLSPGDPGYIARFRGNLFERDRAYHNGTVWPYLLGAFAEALLRVGNFSPRACAEARAVLAPLVAELDSKAPGRLLGQLAEVYDADDRPEDPRQPGGCPAQAWSASEALRVLVMVGRAEAGLEPEGR